MHTRRRQIPDADDQAVVEEQQEAVQKAARKKGASAPHASKEHAERPKKATVHDPPQASDDDDEAPEEVPMSSGKDMAAARRRDEIAAKKAAEGKRKERQKAIEERNVQQKQAKAAKQQKKKRFDEDEDDAGVGAGGGARAATEAGDRAHASPSGQANGAPGALDEDLLPPEVLAALGQRALSAMHGADGLSVAERQARLVSLALKHQERSKQDKRRKILDGGVKKGPVVVRVLSASQRLALAGKGNFRAERLLGPGSAKRSMDMLRPAGMARRGPAAKFT